MATPLICMVAKEIHCEKERCNVVAMDQDDGLSFMVDHGHVGSIMGEGSRGGTGRQFHDDHTIAVAGVLGPHMQAGRPLDDERTSVTISIDRRDHAFLAVSDGAIYSGLCDE